MGTSTNGQICYGIPFEEEFEFPWGEKDLKDWWLTNVLDYKPPFQLYDEHGNHINGHEPSREQVDEYYRHRREFLAEHPLPVELVNFCSNDYPMWIIAVPSSILKACRGDPTEFYPNKLNITEAQDARLIAFCNQHNIETGGLQPQWLLSSYWG